MMHDNEFRTRLDRRLSGLTASTARQARIRAAVARERQPVLPKRRAIAAFALLIALLAGALAVADQLNLFGFFGAKDERYLSIAPTAALEITEEARIHHPHLGSMTAAIDSAYFDGFSLSLAFRMENHTFAEAWSPSSGELETMDAITPAAIVMEQGDPNADVYAAWNNALRSGTPFGYRQFSVYPSDHTTANGVDIPPYAAMADDDETGAYCELREFDAPLPEELRPLPQLDVSIQLTQQETRMWFDGKQAFVSHQRSTVGQMRALIPLTEGAVKTMSGTGSIGGAACQVSVTVSKTAASATIAADQPFSSFLDAPPEDVDPIDTWVEIILVDESGRKYRPWGGLPIDSRRNADITFLGTGELPEALTMYIYAMYEDADMPDLSAMEGVNIR